MDTKKLVVGQKVHVNNDVYGCMGKVVEVTSEGVGVKVDRELMRFDNERRRCQGQSVGLDLWCVEKVVDVMTLVVGQKVDLESGCYCSSGEVVEITPSGVEVKMGGTLVLFDNEGGQGRSRDRSYFGDGRKRTTLA